MLFTVWAALILPPSGNSSFKALQVARKGVDLTHYTSSFAYAISLRMHHSLRYMRCKCCKCNTSSLSCHNIPEVCINTSVPPNDKRSKHVSVGLKKLLSVNADAKNGHTASFFFWFQKENLCKLKENIKGDKKTRETSSLSVVALKKTYIACG